MALITCPECGKQVSSEATKCIHCGYPISQRVTVKETVVNSDALPGANFKSAKKATAKGKSKTKGVVIALVLVLALAAAYVFLISPLLKINSLKFPYDLTPEMDQRQATQALTNKGFKTDYTYGNTTYFLSREIFGYYTDTTHIYMNNDKLFAITHTYAEKGFNSRNPGSKFLDIKQQLEKQYGASTEEPDYLDGTAYVWKNGPYELKLYYYSSDGFQVSYTYFASRAR